MGLQICTEKKIVKNDTYHVGLHYPAQSSDLDYCDKTRITDYCPAGGV